MLPLLLLTTLLLPITQGETCLSRQDILNIVKEMETKIDAETDMMKCEMETKMKAEMETMKAEMETMKAEMETKLGKKDAEMETMRAKVSALERKAEVADLPGALAEAIRDVPQVLVSVTKYYWATPDATITFDTFISYYKSGGGHGTLDLATGVFTCMTPGFYTITFSGYSWLDPGEENMIYAHVRGVMIAESRYRDSSSSGVGDTIQTQGSKTMVSPLTPTHPDPPPLPGRHPRAEGP